MTPLPDSPKVALESFLRELQLEYVDWYESSVTWSRRWWRLSSYVQIFSSFATAILAAIATADWFNRYGVLRVVLIVLPSIAAACTVAVTQSRLHERYQLRENGRRASQTLYYLGCQRFASAATPQEYADIHSDLITRLDSIDKQQGDGFFSLIVASTSKRPAKSSRTTADAPS